ncbi:Rho termination factor domain protein [Halothece sp. PCC 7418]|uniref:DUF4912 domain-containing protein n=1 Tax=Halothece sp. (strain PCC 7418) TaxID=65093 RepID=UPI0002A08437|nr:DUF4912 domain-containing protein [Halothece sp. PCC 7418]AFZ45583.1 Rho termination factor domain protein [Halothece sp. PCC 7418]
MAKARPPLEEMTLRQLRKVASEYNISRYSRMRKAQLLEAIKTIEKQTKQSPSPVHASETQEVMEAAKFELGTSDNMMSSDDLTSVDEGLPELPGGYGKSRIVMMPRDPEWSYVYWDVPNEHKEELRRQGGQQLVLRLYDVTNLDLDAQSPYSVQEYPIDELAREWYVPIPTSDRDYFCEIGYRCPDGAWLMLARSASVHTPPVYPSDWIEDHFIEVDWEEHLEAIPEQELALPESNGSNSRRQRLEDRNWQIYEEIFEMSDPLEGERLAGSFYSSMPPRSTTSSFVFPSGAGLWAVPHRTDQETLTTAEAEMTPQVALVGEAELMVSGKTEPNSTVVVGEKQVQANAEGQFQFQVSFTNGVAEYPVVAYSSQGKPIFSMEMKFTQQSNTADVPVIGKTVMQWS